MPLLNHLKPAFHCTISHHLTPAHDSLYEAPPRIRTAASDSVHAMRGWVPGKRRDGHRPARLTPLAPAYSAGLPNHPPPSAGTRATDAVGGVGVTGARRMGDAHGDGASGELRLHPAVPPPGRRSEGTGQLARGAHLAGQRQRANEAPGREATGRPHEARRGTGGEAEWRRQG